MSTTTLLDLAKLKNGSDGVLHIVEAVGMAAPEVLALPARTIKGTSYDVTLVTKFPETAFRGANKGVDTGKAEFETRKAQCYILDSRIEVDKAVARAHEEGPDALMALYSRLTGKSAILTIGRQIFYGTAEDGTGFPGFREMATADMTVDATGSSSGAGSSAYFVHAGEGGVELIMGEDTTFDLQPFFDGEGEDSAGKKFPAHVSYLNCRPGLSNASPFAVGRIKNLTAQAGKGMTDALAADMIAKFPMDTQPTHIFMNRAQRAALQKSRTVVLQGTGNKGSVGSQAGAIAPIPTEIEGIPIICTDSIISLEAIA